MGYETILAIPVVLALSGEANAQMSPLERLTSRLAREDLVSEKHMLPSKALEEFSYWTNHVLKRTEYDGWTMKTVRKPGRFEFIQAQADSLVVRQLPEVIMIDVPVPKTVRRERRIDDVVNIVREHIAGDWKHVRLAAPREVADALLLRTVRSFAEGTCGDSFIALVSDERLRVFLPKKSVPVGARDFSFSLHGNMRWFSVSSHKTK